MFRPAVVTHLEGCARCGMTHDITFKPLANPMGEFTHWALCPALGEPIMCKLLEEPPTTVSGATTI